ncbi:hypothetical protein SUGI_0982180 [Cryptomeria japonica]|uniref:uncharacterized protein LOC131069400 n=1 Tax=Cryptomeria japonica TaxID=3369 RepID=UPI0024148E55|nr:uncharacterized protein LOC131069400 [Cryptomeria japonica]GLJ46614.1 hypothetical protein SUGI_0982180 [Cryptomeria japonica]
MCPLMGLTVIATVKAEESMESADYSALRPKRNGHAAKKSKCFALNAVVCILVAIIIIGRFLEFKGKSNAFSMKIRNNGSYAELQKSEIKTLEFLQLNSSLKSENERLASELSSLRTRLDGAAECFPNGSDKLEVGALHLACLQEVLVLGKKKIVLTHSKDEDVALTTCSEEKQKQSDQIGDLKREMDVLGDRLRQSVEFLPLQDVKMGSIDEEDRTWFMSTVRERSENGNPELSYFPSEGSNGKILCLKGGNRGNGTLNSYAFAWPNYLPPNSSLVAGLSLISDSFYDYGNPWHSMSSLIVAASWRMENQCEAPQRFVLYHNGELVTSMGSYISSVLLAALDRHVHIQEIGDSPLCFEKAVVYRRGLGHMSLPKRIALFDMIRCKARKFCNIAESQPIIDGIRTINVTLVSRTGPRSFKNESVVASAVAGECSKVPGCKFRLLRSVNLSFCEQVEAMSKTDILVTAHGAQITNMVFMEKGSSVMEMFPKGWLEGAGAGQYVFQWLANWAGMNHEGSYRDSQGPDCPNPQERLPCFLFHKDRQVGHNQTFLAQWTSEVLTKFQNRTSFETSQPSTCPCT